mgnify:CR=1 FL=1
MNPLASSLTKSLIGVLSKYKKCSLVGARPSALKNTFLERTNGRSERPTTIEPKIPLTVVVVLVVVTRPGLISPKLFLRPAKKPKRSLDISVEELVLLLLLKSVIIIYLTSSNSFRFLISSSNFISLVLLKKIFFF